jgi:hypothetical protein
VYVYHVQYLREERQRLCVRVSVPRKEHETCDCHVVPGCLPCMCNARSVACDFVLVSRDGAGEEEKNKYGVVLDVLVVELHEPTQAQLHHFVRLPMPFFSYLLGLVSPSLPSSSTCHASLSNAALGFGVPYLRWM